ncbi:hypothetical protein V8F06_001410 [Rhypophila decipiens]
MYFTALTDEGEFPSFSFDAGGHLKFYSENPQIGYYYAWSPNYQNLVEQEWGSQINFDPAANVPDPSYYFQFDELLLLNHVNMLTVSSQQQQTIEFRVCEESSGKAFWNAATTAYPLSGCTSVDLYIRPSTWPFRLSYLDAAGQKQYFRFSYFLFTDMSQNSIMVPTADITESALFTIDGNRHLWYGLDSQDFSGRLFSARVPSIRSDVSLHPHFPTLSGTFQWYHISGVGDCEQCSYPGCGTQLECPSAVPS